MHPLDIILVICFLPAIYTGVKKGLISQLFAIAALILSIWASFKFSTPVCDWLAGFIKAEGTLLKVIAFAVIFIAIFLAATLLCKLLEKVLKLVMLGWLNKLLGIVFALLKYAIILGLLIVLFNTLNVKFHLVKEEWFEGAKVYEALKNAAYVVFPYLKEMLF